MVNNSKIKIMLQLFFLIIISCTSINKKEIPKEKNNIEESSQDEFYLNTHNGDLIRLPLIKPYELISADNGVTWFLKFQFPEKIKNKTELDNVNLIGIHDSIIVAYSKLTYLPGEMTEAWFVIDVSNNDEFFLRKTKSIKSI